MNVLYVMQRLSARHKTRILDAAEGDWRVIFRDQCSPEEQESALHYATAIFGEPTVEKVLRAENLRWIQMTWAGADRYTKDPAFPQSVLVSNATGAFGVAIAEYLMGAALALLRGFPRYVRQQQSGLWQPNYGAATMEGKNALILGAGDIGTALAARLKAFDVKTIGVRRMTGSVPIGFDEIHGLSALDNLLPEADFVFGCLPGTTKTSGLLTEKRLRAMKTDAVLLNAGRGSLLDLDDLTRVLQEGHLRGAALDVCQTEPLPPEHPLWTLENVLITPHVAGVGFGDMPETEDKIVAILCRNLPRVAAGQTPENLVDFVTGYRQSP